MPSQGVGMGLYNRWMREIIPLPGSGSLGSRGQSISMGTTYGENNFQCLKRGEKVLTPAIVYSIQ